MSNDNIEGILEKIRQGNRCYCGFEDGELSTLLWIEQNSDGMYTYTRSISHLYDVVSSTQSDHSVLNEEALRTLLSGLPKEVLHDVSYVDQDVINENTREKVDLIYSSLKPSPKTVYVVFKEDHRGTKEHQHEMNFNSLFKAREQAEWMVHYLRTKQGVAAYWKDVTLTLAGGEIVLQGKLSPSDRVNARQILVTLLDMDVERIQNFFEG